MSKNTITYWNALAGENSGKWLFVKGTEDFVEELTLSVVVQEVSFPNQRAAS
jgi:hypothetical protein